MIFFVSDEEVAQPRVESFTADDEAGPSGYEPIALELESEEESFASGSSIVTSSTEDDGAEVDPLVFSGSKASRIAPESFNAGKSIWLFVCNPFILSNFYFWFGLDDEMSSAVELAGSYVRTAVPRTPEWAADVEGRSCSVGMCPHFNFVVRSMVLVYNSGLFWFGSDIRIPLSVSPMIPEEGAPIEGLSMESTSVGMYLRIVLFGFYLV